MYPNFNRVNGLVLPSFHIRWRNIKYFSYDVIVPTSLLVSLRYFRRMNSTKKRGGGGRPNRGGGKFNSRSQIYHKASNLTHVLWFRTCNVILFEIGWRAEKDDVAKYSLMSRTQRFLKYMRLEIFNHCFQWFKFLVLIPKDFFRC